MGCSLGFEFIVDGVGESVVFVEGEVVVGGSCDVKECVFVEVDG